VIDPPRPGRTVERTIARYDGATLHRVDDAVVVEEPLEIRLLAGGNTQTLAVTMRTPGNDFELAAGFVHGEGIVQVLDEIVEIAYCLDSTIDAEQRYNIVNITLRGAKLPDMARFERHFTMNSSCGVCGKANLEALRDAGVVPLDDDVRVPIDVIYTLPEKMREAQRIFATTGGLHAAALFNARGQLQVAREDVGRHNAVDKLVGWALTNRRIPLGANVLFVSGRTSYEILQKAAVARIPIVCSVSAPSSLAIDLATEFNVTLIGFVRGTNANVYANGGRIIS
jgi:FdhD protein